MVSIFTLWKDYSLVYVKSLHWIIKEKNAKYFSMLEEKFCISVWPSNILSEFYPICKAQRCHERSVNERQGF